MDLKPPANVALAVVSGGREHCSPEYEIRRSSFPFRGIEFVAQGRGRVVFGGKSTGIHAGSVFSYGPRTGHEIHTDPQDPLVKYFVDFTGSRAAGLLKACGVPPGSVIQTSAPGEILELFEGLIRSGSHHTPFSGRIAALVLEQLLLKLAETSIPNGSAGSAAFDTYRKCRQVIHDRWRELDTLGQIAAACHVDPAYVCRLFRRFDQQSPYQWLLRLKISHAAERLRDGQVTVAAMAGEMGFADPFHFSRVFKKVMGVAPSRFIRMSGR
jgi:AraC-like DNA-binding protein